MTWAAVWRILSKSRSLSLVGSSISSSTSSSVCAVAVVAVGSSTSVAAVVEKRREDEDNALGLAMCGAVQEYRDLGRKWWLVLRGMNEAGFNLVRLAR